MNANCFLHSLNIWAQLENNKKKLPKEENTDRKKPNKLFMKTIPENVDWKMVQLFRNVHKVTVYAAFVSITSFII